jgi:hypothetical protein
MTEKWIDPTSDNVSLTCKEFDRYADNPDPALHILAARMNPSFCCKAGGNLDIYMY